MKKDHEYWMRIALKEAEAAMKAGEIPVAAVLVSADDEVTRGQTQVRRRGSVAAHGELFAVLEAKAKVFTGKRPLTMYTTLEPCLMCLGAMMQAGVDCVVFGMDAAPDGGTRFAASISAGGQSVPTIIAHVLEQEQVKLMREYLKRHSDLPGAPYVRELLKAYPA